MTGSGRAERDDVADRLVKAGIRTLLEDGGLVLVLQKIFDVTHFVMRRQQIFHVDARALLNPEIFAIVKVPRARMADHVHILLLQQDRLFPEHVRHGGQINRLEEVLGKTEYTCRVVTCSKKYLQGIITRVQRGDWPYKTDLRQSFENQT